MKNINLTFRDYQIFMLKSLLLLCLAWGSFALTLFGFFYASIVFGVVGIFGVWIFFKTKSLRVTLKTSREFFLVSLAFLVLTVGFAFFSEPTVFTGRDQGSFSEAAARLAKNHTLEFKTPASSEFFKLHEAGRALNFPGFYYTKDGALITQFSLVYISWLALFFAIFGTTGFIIANGVLLYTFFITFYLLLRLFLRTYIALSIMPLAATSFVFMWFSKFTLSENIALPLVWLTILSLMLFLKNQRRLYYFIFLASVSLLCFTRIEGIAFLVSSIIILSLNKEAKFFIKQHLASRFFFPLFFILTAFIINIYVDAYFYKEIIKALLPKVTSPKAKYLGDIKNNVLPSFYTGKVFYLYGLIWFFIVGGIGTLIALCKKEYYKLIPFFMVLPTFVYFFDSQITPDHPWMLRRFTFSLFPTALFFTAMIIGDLLGKKSYEKKVMLFKTLGFSIIVLLFIMNMPSFLKYVTFSENKDLLSQTKQLTTKFSDNDLILIDQQATGDGWAMLGGPMNYLYGKNAVYFFNNADLNKLDTSKFSNVYLISSNQKVPFYLSSTIGTKLTEIDQYDFHTVRFEKNSPGEVSLPDKKNVTITGKIFKLAR